MAYLRIGDGDLYSEVAGAGEPVLLLHGGFCSLESLRAQSDVLVAGYQVFAFERPGHGRSADIDEEFGYERGVADTVAYLDAVGLESAHVVGYSDGAIIGLLLALDHPGRVRSLTAISANLDPTAFTGSGQETESGQAAESRQAAESGQATESRQAGESSPAAGAEPKPDVERMHYDRLSPDGPEHADVVLAKLFRLWTTEPNIDPKDLARITAPTLIMAADRDTIRPDHTLLIATSIPGAQLCIVPGTTHGLVAEKPDLISTIIRDFLDGQPRRSNQTK
ncbi:alpha/beta fold hydrolase [Actinoplanes sichuanensis]|uniref:Alpha/beta fold hydrolase n=1 Tax=Actinoplanes sichuanensis TaxID=512349 RepID=A0ABW4AQ19_9ACTN|nr:alpha/beta hydrolase [Actinoplanes sichuanensis]